ncbi:hypothetical protein AMTR_s00003p00269590 [Amborella trichopoda]|uniref:Uncharacterized protein n=2 Tax=Amborella trichopoda TaxID=13333 RepID=W1P6D7_AMBTC|nr:hypothetical protein AMTR_s00003p00269590 [Amborella trichopoda]
MGFLLRSFSWFPPLNSDPLFSFLVAWYTVIFLYFPVHIFQVFLSPVTIFTGVLLASLLHLGGVQRVQNRKEITIHQAIEWPENREKCVKSSCGNSELVERETVEFVGEERETVNFVEESDQRRFGLSIGVEGEGEVEVEMGRREREERETVEFVEELGDQRSGVFGIGVEGELEIDFGQRLSLPKEEREIAEEREGEQEERDIAEEREGEQEERETVDEGLSNQRSGSPSVGVKGQPELDFRQSASLSQAERESREERENVYLIEELGNQRHGSSSMGVEGQVEVDFRQRVSFSSVFGEWNHRAPLEVIYEEYEGEEEEDPNNILPKSPQKLPENSFPATKGAFSWVSDDIFPLGSYLPDSDSGSSSEDDMEPENGCFWWEEEREGDNLIEISLSKTDVSPATERFQAMAIALGDDENLIEIDLSDQEVAGKKKIPASISVLKQELYEKLLF